MRVSRFLLPRSAIMNVAGYYPCLLIAEYVKGRFQSIGSNPGVSIRF
jgi:hypothetical protein